MVLLDTTLNFAQNEQQLGVEYEKSQKKLKNFPNITRE
jgi:hypothetical protein